MKLQTMTTIILCFYSCLLYQVSGQGKGVRTAENRALEFGAKTEVVFMVVDENNAPVSDVLINAGFYMNGKSEYGITGKTNYKGIFTAENTSVGEINYDVTKNGWYRHVDRIRFFGPGKKDTVIDGKWQPYGATYRIVLRRKKNPIPMYMKRVRRILPVNGEFVGYDFVNGDWLAPHGNGEIPDILFKYEEQPTENFWTIKSILTMRFPNEADGAYIREKIPGSEFPSDYLAKLQENYQKEWIFVYDMVAGKTMVNSSLKENQYLVLRTRTQVDATGNLTTAHYTKIYGELGYFRGTLFMQYYFNPNPNDTNLEFALGKSLFENQRTNLP